MKSTNRRCSHCRKKITTEEAIIGGLRAFCSYDHLQQFMQGSTGQKIKKLSSKKEARTELREVRQKHKTKSDHKKEAQSAFNAYIRARDEGKPCISCGNMPESYYGGGVDAGHYRSRGSAPQCSFNLYNVHAQCKRCNRYLSGNVTEYRKGLVQRIGLDKVEALENDEEIRRFDVAYYQRIKSIFTRKKKLLERLRVLPSL